MTFDKKYCGSNIYVHFVFMKLYKIDEIRCSFLLVSLNRVYMPRCGCWGCFIFLTIPISYPNFKILNSKMEIILFWISTWLMKNTFSVVYQLVMFHREKKYIMRFTPFVFNALSAVNLCLWFLLVTINKYHIFLDFKCFLLLHKISNIEFVNFLQIFLYV